jgi:DNA topoisomerase VI subunit B
MISMKVNNPEIWDKVKSGEIKGFSIEGYFADKMEMQSEKEIFEQLKKLLENVK